MSLKYWNEGAWVENNMFILVDQLHGKILENIDINIRNPFISHVDKQFQREYGDAKKKILATHHL